MCGGTLLWVELTVPDDVLNTARQAAVDEHYDLYAEPAFDVDEVAWPLCSMPSELPPRPACWVQMMNAARRLGERLGVFARLDFYADAARGPLLGEVTLTPNMGQSPALHTPWVNEMVRSRWHGADGAPAQHDSAAASSLRDALSECVHGVITPWSSADILAAVDRFDLGPWGVAPGSRVALQIPTGPHAALCLLACMNKYCALPLDPHAPSPLTSDALRRLRASCLLAPTDGAVARIGTMGRAEGAAHAVGIRLIEVDITGAPRDLLPMPRASAPAAEVRTPRAKPMALSDTVLVLSTSGTTGHPKGVPFSLARLFASGRALAASMELGTGDVGLNMGLPLHHVGGIACNLMAPLVSRGRAVFEAAFSAESWLQSAAAAPEARMEAPTVTWCYQVATMWGRIAALRRDAANAAPRHHLRLVRSGASFLPHEDATSLAAQFGCCVLPTYSMTECMPIASPPLGYTLDAPGSVGAALGDLQVAILQPLEREGEGAHDPSSSPPSGVRGSSNCGEIALDGSTRLFAQYEGEPARSSAFRTGDLGRLEGPLLYITGRAREMINRGGEVLAPVQLEEIFARHPALAPHACELMVFAAPHADVQEVPGLALALTTTATAIAAEQGFATSPSSRIPQLRELRAWARGCMPVQAIPPVLVLVPFLPRTTTGKLQRVGFSSRVGLPLLRGVAGLTFVHVPGQPLRQLHEDGSLPKRAPACGAPCEYAAAHGASSDAGVRVEAQAALSAPAPCATAPGRPPASATGRANALEVAAFIRGMASSGALGGSSGGAGDAFSDDDALFDVGAFDSLSAVNLALGLRERTHQPIPLTLLWDYPSIRSIVRLVAADGHHDSGAVQAPARSAVSGGAEWLTPGGGSAGGGEGTCCLFLHGMALNGTLMLDLLRAAGWVAQLPAVTFVCEDAPHEAPACLGLYASLVASGLYDEATRCYDYGLGPDEEMLVQKGLAVLEAQLIRHRPEVVGGICDGGLLAAVLATRCAEVRLLVNVCGTPWERLPHSLRASGAVEVPSLHLLGRADELLTEDELLSLPRRCSEATILRHPQGHALPVLSARLTSRMLHAIDTACHDNPKGTRVEALDAWRADDDCKPLYAGRMPMAFDADGREEPFGLLSEESNGGDALPDSIQMFIDSGVRLDCAVTAHVYFVSLLFVVVGHWHELWLPDFGNAQSCMSTSLPSEGDAAAPTWCGRGFGAMLTVGHFFTVQAFVVIAGTVDARLPPAMVRTLARNTLLVVGTYLWFFFFSDLPETIATIVDEEFMAGYHREMAWFGMFLLLSRLLHAALATARLRWLLPLLGVAVHFGCWAGHCAWPLRRAPFDFEALPPASPTSRFAILLPKTGAFPTFFIYYSTVPTVLPRGFPRVYPDPFSRLLSWLPGGTRRRWLLARSQAAARMLWCLVLLLIFAACTQPSVRASVLRLDRATHGGTYGCRVGDCTDQRWRLDVMLLDLGGVGLSASVVVGLAAVVPRQRSLFSWVGGRSFQVYVLHDFAMMRIGPHLFKEFQRVRAALHGELVIFAVLACACLVACMFAAVPLDRLPPLWSPWVAMLRGTRSARPAEGIPLMGGTGVHPTRKAGTARPGPGRATGLSALLPLLLAAGVAHRMGGLRFSRQLTPIAQYAFGLEREPCQILRRHAPEPCPSGHGARNCAAQRLCEASAPAHAKQSTSPRGRKDHGAAGSVARPAVDNSIGGQSNVQQDNSRRGTHRGRSNDCEAALLATAIGPGSTSGQCGSRGRWLTDNLQMSATGALQHLARQFPDECGLLAEERCLASFMHLMRVADRQTGTPTPAGRREGVRRQSESPGTPTPAGRREGVKRLSPRPPAGERHPTRAAKGHGHIRDGRLRPARRHGEELLELQSLAAYPLAVCNDGSAAAYYYRRGAARSQLWLIQLEGSGLCFSAASCSRRCTSGSPGSGLCSSQAYNQTMRVDGILHSSSPELGSANKVYVRYCSSDAFLGNASAFGLQFRGQAIVQAVLADLVVRRGLGRPRSARGGLAPVERDVLVLAGSSSGSYGAMAHLDYVPAMLGAHGARHVHVVGLLDSALVLLEPPADDAANDPQAALVGRDDVPSRFALMDEYLHSARHGDACLAAHAPPPGTNASATAGIHSMRWKCLLGRHRLPHLSTPYLLAGSQYDTLQVASLLGTQPGVHPRDKGEEASAAHLARILVHEARKVQREAASRNVSVGLFFPACFDHATTLMTQAGFEMARPTLGESAQGALSRFLVSRQLTLIDGCDKFACGSCPEVL